MSNIDQEEPITQAINTITEKLGNLLLKEFMQLPEELHLNVILIKSSQLLLANVLCHVAANKTELTDLADHQAVEVKELTFNCAFSGFANKFEVNKH
jgi:hypothetical protein